MWVFLNHSVSPQAILRIRTCWRQVSEYQEGLMILKPAMDDSPIAVGELMLIRRRNGRDGMGHNGIL